MPAPSNDTCTLKSWRVRNAAIAQTLAEPSIAQDESDILQCKPNDIGTLIPVLDSRKQYSHAEM